MTHSNITLVAVLCIFLNLVSFGSCHKMVVENYCPHPVWLGTLESKGDHRPLDGGHHLGPKTQVQFTLPHGWEGRFWGRTGCHTGVCETGDCGGVPKCRPKAGGVPPATLAEFKFNGDNNMDFYDVSLVDGYNLPMKIVPIQGSFRKKEPQWSNKYDCGIAGCQSDLNARCPEPLQHKVNGRVVACLSACEKHKNDPNLEIANRYCCKGNHDTPITCRSSDWPHNYPGLYFKPACPDAYSYAYDDQTSTFTCQGNPVTGYRIIFC